ncbi:uncharacterized protein F5891DRAFT_1001706 [Suillus fuscotomentosus]|uniref:Uncharacterized protein n=1 Tax=Suillus fuscotomentosus TaxID=1912939 RepID=A0AAD4EJT7_9AGAM|nr:uncharacterized protein F5891DRAFT_1001706 [Suillus fuscotomentosus]KAG1907427.1 hypothetical protein F5891DRAFT_1001706 [Suillus fuscotomentosus]
MSNHEDGTKRYDVTPILESRYFILPASAALVGVFIGAVRGSRLASLRFLAENAHRPPKTIRGWYLYNKTKNYKRMAAGLLSGGKEGVKLGATALVWVGIEDGLGRCGAGFDDLKEVGAGVGTAGAFSIVYRLRWRSASRALMVGSIIGGGMGFLRWAREYLKRARGDFI